MCVLYVLCSELQTSRLRVIGLTFIREAIDEFSVGHGSTALGITWDYHMNCHRSFEKLCLHMIFCDVFALFVKIMERSILLNREELVRPGPAWENVLIESKLLEYLAQAHNIMLTESNNNNKMNEMNVQKTGNSETNAQLLREALLSVE